MAQIDSTKLVPSELSSRDALDPKKLAKYNKLKRLNQKLKEAGIYPDNDYRLGKGDVFCSRIDISAEDIVIARKNTKNMAKFKDALSDLFVYMYTSGEDLGFENAGFYDHAGIVNSYLDALNSDVLGEYGEIINTVDYCFENSEEIAGEFLLKLNAVKGKKCLEKHNIKFSANECESGSDIVRTFGTLGLKFETANNQKINAVIGNKKIGIDLVVNASSKLKLTEIFLIENEDGSIILRAYYEDKRPHPLNGPWRFNKDYVLKSPEIQ